MSAHAKLGPSAAERWMTCTASVELIDDMRDSGLIPADQTSIYAAEGTVAHEIREMCLTFNLDPHSFVGSRLSADGYSFTVEDDMARHLTTGIDWIREMTDSPDVEIRVDLSHWLPDQFGTCDTGWINDTTLYVSDLKYGQGENVEVEGNKQLRLYALGYWAYRGFPTITNALLHIDQPRAGGQKFWEITADELIAFGEEAKAAYAEIMSGDTKFAPGSKACRWCPVKDHGCPARDEWLFGMIADRPDAFEGDAPKFPTIITPERRWEIVKHSSEIKKWLGTLYNESLNEALAGNPDPGSKVVAGDLGDRRIKDQETAKRILVKALGRHAFQPRKLIGITDIEKLLKPGRKKPGNKDAWIAIQELVDRAEGKPKLVPIEHAAPPLVSVDVDEFDDLD